MSPATTPLHPRLAGAIARLDALIDWEKRDRSAGFRVSVDPMRDLVERLGHPERGIPAVHVAGTKGKGSVAALVAAGLGHAGLRTGLYASPHVERFHERVRVDGQDVADETLADGIEAALVAREGALREGSAGRDATWFDLVTAAAFAVFRRARVDWNVVEVGLGGRLDSTNVLAAEVAVVTNIDLEHTAVLGATRAAIAAEKAGILDPRAVCVSGVGPGRGDPEDDAAGVIAARAAELGTELIQVPPAPGAGIEARNVDLARAVLDALGRRGHRTAAGEPLSAVLLDGPTIRAARLPGRLERRSWRGRPVVLDGAHVPSSLAEVLSELGRDPSLHGPPEVVLALAREKDAGGCLKALAGVVDRVHCTTVASGIHRPADELVGTARRLGLRAVAFADPVEAFSRAWERAAPRGWVLVTGSLYVVGEVRKWLQGAPVTDVEC